MSHARWYVESDNDARDLYVCEDRGGRVATIERQGFGAAKGVDWKRARLIAAAPELLESCKELYQLVVAAYGYTGRSHGDTLNKAHLAIAKATGAKQCNSTK